MFLLAVFAIGLSTMDAVFSATQCAFQYDILPGLATKGTPEMSPRQKVRATRLFGLTTYLVVIGLFYLAEKYLTFGRDNYLALLLAFYSAQIAFIPLVAGAFLARRRGRSMTPVEPGFAIASLLGGTLVGIGSTLSALVFGPNDVLLWGAIPECLLVSTIIYAIGWFRAH